LSIDILPLNARTLDSAAKLGKYSSVIPSPEKEAAFQPMGYAVIGLGRFAQGAILPGFRQSKKAKLVALVSGDGLRPNPSREVELLCSYPPFMRSRSA